MPVLYLLSVAFKIWMVVDAIQRRAGYIWLMVIFLLPFGEWVYFFMVRHKAGPPRAAGRATRMDVPRVVPRQDLAALRFHYDETPSIQNQVALAQGLHDHGELDEAAELFEDVLRKRGKERAARYGLARCRLGRGQHPEAIQLLRQLLEQDKSYLDFAPWADLAEAQQAAGDTTATLQTLEDLVRASPRIGHKVLLAQQLVRLDQPGPAREVLVEALEAYRVAPKHVQKTGRQAASAAQELLGTLGSPA